MSMLGTRFILIAVAVNSFRVKFDEAIKNSIDDFKTIKLFSDVNVMISLESYGAENVIKLLDFPVKILDIEKSISKLNDCNLVLANNFEDIERFFNRNQQVLNSNAIFIIAVLSMNFEKLEKLFQVITENQIRFVHVIYRNSSEVLTVTQTLYSSNQCNHPTQVIVKRTSNKISSNFYESFKNFHQCPVKIAIHNNMPYMSIEGCDSATKICKFSGRDYHLLESLAKVLNFRMVLKVFDHAGSLFINGTSTGPIASVINGNSDILIGDYFLKLLRRKYMDNSYPYTTSSTAIVVPPGAVFTSFENLYKPFELSVWIVCFICLICATVAILIINRRSKAFKGLIFGTNHFSPIMEIFSVILGVSQASKPKKIFARFLVMSLLIQCLVLRTAYQASLFKFLHDSIKHEQIETIDEIVENELPIYTHILNEDFLKEQNRFNKLKINYEYNLNGSLEIALRRLKDPLFKGVLAITYPKLLYINQINLYNFTYQVAREKLFFTPVVIYYKRNFPLLDVIDVILMRLFEAGLIEQLNKEMIHSHKSKSESKPLAFPNLIGTFVVLIAGCSIGAVFFGFERISFEFYRCFAFIVSQFNLN